MPRRPPADSRNEESPPAELSPGPIRLQLSARRHTGFVAASQEGKTTLMKALLRRAPANTVLIDIKRQDFSDLGWPVVHDPAGILQHARVIWQPPLAAVRCWDDTRMSDPWSLGLHYIWTVRGRPGGGGVLVACDEIRTVAPTDPHPIVSEIIVQGMGRGVGLWWASQTAWKLSTDLLHQSPDMFLGALRSSAQRHLLDANLEVTVGHLLGSLPRYHFIHVRAGAPPSAPFQLSDLGMDTRSTRKAPAPELNAFPQKGGTRSGNLGG